MTRNVAWTDVVSAALLITWFLYLLLAPTVGFGWIESWHNEQRAAQVVLLAATALGFCAMLLDRNYRLQVPRIHWIVVAVLALGAISASRAAYADAAYAELALHFLLLVLIFASAAAVARHPARALTLAQYGALVLLATYVAGVAVQYVAAVVSLRRALTVGVLMLGYSNARFPSALHALLIPFVATLSADPRRQPALRALGFAVLACTWAINLALATRAIWFAYAVALPILWATLGWRRIRPAALVTTASAVAGLGLYALFFRGLPVWLGLGESFQRRTLDQLVWGSNRELLIRSSLEAIRSAPWLGIGPMQFAAIPKVWAAHPHNWVLQLASEWGLPAACLAIGGALGLFRSCMRQIRAGDAAAPGLLPSFVTATIALIYGLVDGNLVMPISQSAAAILLGVLLGSSGSVERRGDSIPQSLRLATVWVLACAIATAHVGSFTLRTVQAATAIERGQDYFPTRALWPRFWSDGFLPLEGSPRTSR